MIDKLKANIPALVVGVAVLAFAGLLIYNGVKTDTASQSEITVPTDDSEKMKSAQKTPKQYSLTAEDGASYTVIARQIVQEYAKLKDLSLTKAQIIAAETMLTQDAGAPLLDVGQKVTIKTTAVHNAVTKARALSADEIAAWETYVPYVQF